MQSASFGRKGLPDTDLARRRAAFIAAERARMAGSGESPSVGFGEPGGAPVTMPVPPLYRPAKSLALAYILWFFACQLGAHRFYLGAWRSAAIQLGTWLGSWLVVLAGTTSESLALMGLGLLGLLGWIVWMIADLFLIPGLRAKANSGQDIARTFA